MMRSMTGYGKETCELANKVVTIEVKSLNSKQLDIYSRIPSVYREKDLEIRNILSQRLQRGKIEVNMVIEVTDVNSNGKLNVSVIKDYYKQLKEIGSELGIDYNDSVLQVIMRLPDSLKTDKEELDTQEWQKVEKALAGAIDAVDRFRLQEGKAMKTDMLEKLELIEQCLQKIQPFEQERVNAVKQRLQNGLNDLPGAEKTDTNRFEQELIYYLEKLDINEEKVRLRNHCSFFAEVCNSKEPSGKKLGFIAQEMGREINTIGSKANHSEIQRLVVMMKDELEKIKEQSLNIL
ncbi:MAG: YicC family protein [Bacteroidales bacterium]|nr:YicC family protein [Bacteroidales bacterium]